MNGAKAESLSTRHSKHNYMPRISKQKALYIHYKVTGLQSLEKLYVIFAQKRALPCVTKIILTEKLFGVGSSNMLNWIIGQRTKKN